MRDAFVQRLSLFYVQRFASCYLNSREALLGGGLRSSDARLPRPRVGRAAARRPRAVREARAGRLPGGPVVGSDPPQAGAFSRGVRRVRPGAHGPLPGAEARAAPPGPRD